MEYNYEETEMKGIIISVINNKGGVGKTTVTCNLGHALTRHGKRILRIA
jgi:cellulose biosynthesis protein BcsQ